jgi:hypothetical protein
VTHPHDFRHDPVATANRTAKAMVLVAHARRTGLDLGVITDPRMRRSVEWAAVLRRCSDETWAAAVRLFDAERDRDALTDGPLGRLLAGDPSTQ